MNTISSLLPSSLHKQLCRQTEIGIHTIASPIGDIVFITNKNALLYLTFSDYFKETQLHLSHYYKITDFPIHQLIHNELSQYFENNLKQFNIPVYLEGTPLQKTIWQNLSKIPYGTTLSYIEQATQIGNSKASRAVARINSLNPIPIIIPCHRIIRHNGLLGGYAGGINRKQWLLTHENTNL